MSHIPGTAAAENGGDFDPSQAAALLEQATGQIGWTAWMIRRGGSGARNGPAGAWLIMGIGLAAVCLGTAEFIARQQRRSAVWP
jgi:hypothetical protein